MSMSTMPCVRAQGFWSWDNRESLIEYGDDDRFANEAEAAARSISPVFSHAARQQSAPPHAALPLAPGGAGGGGAPTKAAGVTAEARLRESRTVRQLLRRLVDGPPPAAAAAAARPAGLAAEGGGGAELASSAQREIAPRNELESSVQRELRAWAQESDEVQSPLLSDGAAPAARRPLYGATPPASPAPPAPAVPPAATPPPAAGRAPHRSRSHGEDDGADFASEETKSMPESSRRRRRVEDKAAPPAAPEPALPVAGRLPPPSTPPPMPPAVSLPPPPLPNGSTPLTSLPPLPHPASAGVVARAELDDFGVNDVLLWLQVTAFRSRPPLAGQPPQGNTRQAHRQQIREEIRTLKRRSDAELVPSPPSAAVEVRL